MPKYGLFFLIFIIAAKIIYLFVEVYYTGYLIEVITNNSVTPVILENLEKLGHNVSSVGLTLLFTPLSYLLFKRFMPYKKLMPVCVLSFMLVAFFSFHSLLSTLIQEVVHTYKEKRYASYYVSTFKYAMLNGSVGYETFIPKENLGNLDVLDRVLISNMFLLNYIDDDLIDRLIKRGQEQFIDVFILKYSLYDYDKSRKAFEDKIAEITKYYNEYYTTSKAISKRFNSKDRESVVSKKYSEFTKSLSQEYSDYEAAVIVYEEAIDVDDPHKYQILEKAALKKFHKKYKGLPTDLSARAFYNHRLVKNKIIKELKKHGLYVKANFNYSKSAFAQAYKNKISRAFKKDKRALYLSMKAKTSKSIPFGLSYNQFAYRFKGSFEKEFGTMYAKVAYKMLAKRDSSEFYSKLYKPYFKENNLEKYLLSREDFVGDEHALLGDNAIKHLYVPPFAIAISLLTGILNLISVLALIVFIFIKLEGFGPWQRFGVKAVFKVAVLALLATYPYYQVDKLQILQKYKALATLQEDKTTANYVKMLEWVMVYENITYKTLYPPLKRFKYLVETLPINYEQKKEL